MNKEYIERGALCHKIQAFASKVIFDGCDEMLIGNDSCNPAEWTRGYRKGVADATGVMMGQPTADVVEVKHSEWKYYYKQNIAVCMNCSFERDLNANFGKAISCPNCGAEMDGECRER